MSLQSNSVALLNAGLQAAGGEEGTYRRGNDAIDNLIAVPARVVQDDYGQDAASITSLDKDWIFLAEQLTKDGQRWTPRRGDQWDCNGRTYNVLPRANNRCSRPTDPTEVQIRVFTVETKPRTE